VFLPCDARQTRALTRWLAANDGPAYVRMGRAAVADVYENGEVPFTPGKANLLRDGKDLTFIACGELVRHALDAADLLEQDGIGARVLYMHTLKPLVRGSRRRGGRRRLASSHPRGAQQLGGLGAAVAQIVAERCRCPCASWHPRRSRAPSPGGSLRPLRPGRGGA
jgi:transketolase